MLSRQQISHLASEINTPLCELLQTKDREGALPWWSNAGGPGSIPGQGTRPHMLQHDPVCLKEVQRIHVLQLRPGAVKVNS